ncbi:UrcA family protein [Asticcacaulis sp. 201]|uniref:UrcA family protein n=1 Tax=Asticcacaulis sp. 201 TaxID=3028787 RepID=UPI002916547D|nr:UrcA family protein [Asticcacaulis sp. 201]MDV6330291.1 UrcA family protein [Asticcacaulis sp. 201]
MFYKILTAAVCAGTMVCAFGAAAAEGNVSRIPVTFENRDLNDPARSEAAYARLYKVVQRVCDTVQAGPRYRADDDRACEEQAMDEAIANLGSQEMRRLHKREIASQGATTYRARR